jgi:phytoene synthase
MDPATEISVAHLKLAWWQEEMDRLARGSAVHPISLYLAALPRAAQVDFTPLSAAVAAAAAQVSGAPLERGSDLEPQSRALWGDPMALVSQLADDVRDETGLRNCTSALAAADYLSKAIRGYRRDAQIGRVPFAIDELLAAGVDNDDLATDPPPPHLQSYLDGLRKRAARYFETAALALPRAQRARHRHLPVLAALGQARLNSRAPSTDRRWWKDMLLAWTTARRPLTNRSSHDSQIIHARHRLARRTRHLDHRRRQRLGKGARHRSRAVRRYGDSVRPQRRQTRWRLR